MNLELHKQNILKSIKNHDLKWLDSNTIFLTVRGSHSYGLNTESSDVDFGGIAIPPKEYVFGFVNSFEQTVHSGDYDGNIFSIFKFFKLAALTNPNCTELLFVDEEHVFRKTRLAQKLIDNRDLFVSAEAYYRYAKYAESQLKRMKTHRGFILNPPKAPPVRSDYGLPETRKPINSSDLGAYNKLAQDGIQVDENVMAVVFAEKRYQAAERQWQQFQNWKTTRNPKRYKEEVESHFDRKNATHLVRLFLTCEEILTGKGIIVKRPDKDFLLEIRSGKWSYEQVCEWSDKQSIKCEKLYNDLMSSEKPIIPKKPNMRKLDNLLIEIVEEFYRLDKIAKMLADDSIDIL